MQLAPQSATYHNALAYLYETSLHNEVGPEVIQRHLATALRLAQVDVKKSQSADNYYQLGLALQGAKRWKEAVTAFENVLRYDPTHLNALRHASFDAMLVRNGWAASRHAQGFLKTGGWKEQQSPFIALSGYVGLLQVGRDEEAQSLLARSASRLNAKTWPYLIIKYLQGELSEAQLSQAVGQNHNRKSEAWAYIGVHLALTGRAKESLPYLRWVKSFGNKAYIEYDLASRELPLAEATASAQT